MKNLMTLKIKVFVVLLLLLFSGFIWWGAYEADLPAPAKAADDYEAMMDRLHPLGIPEADFVRCTNPRARLQCKNGICTTSTNPEACIFYGGVLGPVVFTATVTATVEAATPAPGETPAPVPAPPATTPTPQPTPVVVAPTTNNLIKNGNFEFGFYQVPQLGFEIPDVGNVPHSWQWYRNPAYGKYNINNNQTLGLICADDLTAETRALLEQRQAQEDAGFGPVPGSPSLPEPNNAAVFQIQSSDQLDARMGIYQVVDVVPGQTYRLSLSGTIQIQEGAGTLQPDDPEAPQEAQNHTVELFFDYRGGTDWKAVPQEEKLILPWKEDDVLFRYESDDDEGKGVSEIEDFETLVTARTNKLTIFIGAWRKWANWRSGHITIDCVSLVPGNRLLGEAAAGGQPAAAGQSGPGLPVTGEEIAVPNYIIITGQGLKESPRFGRVTR